MTTAPQRFASFTNRLYPRLTASAGTEVAAMSPTGDLRALASRKHCTVVSYRRSGEPVAAPVWFGLADGRLYFRSLADAAKLRRIARRPDVLVAPCNFRGAVRGAPFAATARILDGADEAIAEAAIEANYGIGRRLYRRLIAGAAAVYVEVSPAGSST